MGMCGLDSSGSGRRTAADCSENGNEPSGSLDKLSDC